MYNDIQDSWESVTTIVDWVGDNAPTNGMLDAAGPGSWNDPDSKPPPQAPPAPTPCEPRV